MNKLGDFVNVDFAQGCTNHRLLPALKPEWLTPVGGELGTGLTIGYFNNLDLSGEPVWSTVTKHTRQMWLGQIGPNVNPSPNKTREGKKELRNRYYITSSFHPHPPTHLPKGEGSEHAQVN
ncbi:MAG: hypothetical protein GY801_02765 [bacterium]|nr:hypothetical protein [bacterium]